MSLFISHCHLLKTNCFKRLNILNIRQVNFKYFSLYSYREKEIFKYKTKKIQKIIKQSLVLLWNTFLEKKICKHIRHAR